MNLGLKIFLIVLGFFLFMWLLNVFLDWINPQSRSSRRGSSYDGGDWIDFDSGGSDCGGSDGGCDGGGD